MIFHHTYQSGFMGGISCIGFHVSAEDVLIKLSTVLPYNQYLGLDGAPWVVLTSEDKITALNATQQGLVLLLM